MKYKMLLFFLIMALPALACGEATPAKSVPTPPPTPASIPSATSLPQPTAEPTPTSHPTATELPTPIDTPQPSPTSEPTEIPTPDRQQATVLRVIDGDTIEVQIGEVAYTLRYIGIDTPETKHPEKGIEWMGQEAAAANEALVGGQVVELEKDVSETDKYGRLLRYVWVGEVMVNAALVSQGYAQVVTYPPDVKHAEGFLALQEEARAAGRGLWGPTPIAEKPTVAVPTQTEAPPEPPPAPAAVCDCSGNKYNCSDFSTHAAAQACYDYCVGQGRGDIHRLDGDSNGLACESLP